MFRLLRLREHVVRGQHQIVKTGNRSWMTKPDILRFGPLGEGCVHLCVDMQRMFASGTPWAAAWVPAVLPHVEELVAHRPERTIFTRFIPARSPGQAQGVWQRYYRRWNALTLEHLDESLVELLPELERYAPPARVVDKVIYSPWLGSDLYQKLRAASVDTLIISGGETDVCVLDTVLGAVNGGFRVVIATDALCSSRNATHDALLALYRSRFTEQIETAPTRHILQEWR